MLERTKVFSIIIIVLGLIGICILVLFIYYHHNDNEHKVQTMISSTTTTPPPMETSQMLQNAFSIPQNSNARFYFTNTYFKVIADCLVPTEEKNQQMWNIKPSIIPPNTDFDIHMNDNYLDLVQIKVQDKLLYVIQTMPSSQLKQGWKLLSVPNASNVYVIGQIRENNIFVCISLSKDKKHITGEDFNSDQIFSNQIEFFSN